MPEKPEERPAISGQWGDAFGASTATTIDQTTNDNGYLVCMRRHFPGNRLHPTTKGAVDNLLAISGKSVQIVGHGDAGIIVTGTGQSASDPAKYIALGNQSRWKPDVARLKTHVDSLRLIACYTGAEAAGANLLYEMAKECGASVSASTGLTWCGPNGWWLDPGARWQVATPTHKPQPIPKDPQGRSFGGVSMIVLIDDTKRRSLTDEDVTSATYQPAAGIQPRAGGPVALKGLAALDLVGLVNFAEPFEPGGVPGALVTREITLAFKPEDEKRRFVVYADSILQDATNPGVFYRTNDGFAEALRTLV
jgi:hypothetical protein